MKKFIILIIILFSWINIVSANFEITEIMYDLEGTDASREWVEVKNIGSESQDISKWYFFSDNTKHKLTPVSTSNVGAGEYVVIAQNVENFKKDWPSYSGVVFDSSWTDFSNTGESFSLMDENQKIIDTISYASSIGAGGNGYSLQKLNGLWLESKPTPGMENKLSLNPKPIFETKNLPKSIENKGFSGENENNFSSQKSNEIINLNEVKQKKEISTHKINNETLAYIGLGLIIFIGALVIILTRKKQKEDILEKGLTAKDIKILE